MLKDAWGQRMDQGAQAKADLKRQIKDLDKRQDALLGRIVETSNPKVVAAFETKIAKLEEEKFLLDDQLSQNTQPAHTVGEIFELLRDFLSNPWNLYEKGHLRHAKQSSKPPLEAHWPMTTKADFERRKPL